MRTKRRPFLAQAQRCSSPPPPQHGTPLLGLPGSSVRVLQGLVTQPEAPVPPGLLLSSASSLPHPSSVVPRFPHCKVWAWGSQNEAFLL